MYAPRDRAKILSIGALLVACIAVMDWLTKPYLSLGFLYLFPILLVAGFLNRQQILIIGVGCAILSEMFSALESSAEIPRTALVAIALAGGGLFFRELIHNRQLVVQHMGELEEQFRLRRDAEEQLRVLVETSPVAILTTDGNGSILIANHAAEAMFGVDPAQARGDSICRYLPNLETVLGNDHMPVYRTAIQCPGHRRSGEIFLAEVWFSTYATDAGPRLAAIVADLSEEENTSTTTTAVSGNARALVERAIETLRLSLGSLPVVAPPALEVESSGPDNGTPLKKLTERETQVLRLVLEGLTNKEIGTRLQVSESSVKATLQQLFAKVAVRTRSQLVRVALESYRDQFPR